MIFLINFYNLIIIRFKLFKKFFCQSILFFLVFVGPQGIKPSLLKACYHYTTDPDIRFLFYVRNPKKLTFSIYPSRSRFWILEINQNRLLHLQVEFDFECLKFRIVIFTQAHPLQDSVKHAFLLGSTCFWVMAIN